MKFFCCRCFVVVRHIPHLLPVHDLLVEDLTDAAGVVLEEADLAGVPAQVQQATVSQVQQDDFAVAVEAAVGGQLEGDLAAGADDSRPRARIGTAGRRDCPHNS